MYTNIEWAGIDHGDYPDYVDAYIVSADLDGEPMTSEELDVLNDNSELIYELLSNHLY